MRPHIIIVLICAILVESRTRNSPEAQLRQSRRTTTTEQTANLMEHFNNILENPQFGALLEQLHQQFQKLQNEKTTTTTEPVNLDKNPFIQALISSPQEQPNFHTSRLSNNPFLQFTTTPSPTRRSVFIGFDSLKSSTTPQPPINPVRHQSAPSRSSELDALKKTLEEEAFKQQAQEAKYAFSSDVEDTINQNAHQREEVRDGLKVKGKYSYSDGFYKRTVEYEADEKGYRVVGESVEAIGRGPEHNPDGHAKVATYVDGNAVKYEITGDDIHKGPTVHQAEPVFEL